MVVLRPAAAVTARQPTAALLSRDPIPHVGGKSTQIESMARNLRKRGWDVRVVSPGELRAPAQAWVWARYKVRRLLFGRSSARWWYERTMQSSLARMLSRRTDDVRIAHDVVAFAALGAEAPSAALVVHSDLTNELVGARWIDAGSDAERWCVERETAAYRSARLIVTVDVRLAEHVTALGPPSGILRVLPNAVDTEWWTPPDEPRQPDLVVASRRLEQKNGVEILVRACALSLAGDRPWRLLLLGGGQLRAALENLAAELGVEPKVVFAAQQPPEVVRDAYRRAAVAVVPSIPTRGLVEATSYSALEAMSTATPLVASAIGGLAEIVEDGRSGLLVPPEDPVALAAAIDHVLADPELATAMGRTGRQRVIDRYSMTAWGDAWAELITEVTARP